MKRRLLMWILWPAFLCAALAELVVFAVVDPADLRFFGEQIAVSHPDPVIHDNVVRRGLVVEKPVSVPAHAAHGEVQ